jgi:membrane fusion protein (multidrug efflux system)
LRPCPASAPGGERLLSQAGVIRLWNTARDLEIQLERHQVRAPFGGTVVSADLRPGATARLGTVIGRLQNLDDLEVEVEVSGADIHLVRPGSPVTVALPGSGETVSGRVERVSRRIDEATRTIPVHIGLSDGADRLVEGAFVEARITGSVIADAVRIPGFTLGQGNRVGLVRGGLLARQPVTVLHTEGDTLVVGPGLAEGDTLVLDLLQGVADGTRLRDSRTPRPGAAPTGGTPK